MKDRQDTSGQPVVLSKFDLDEVITIQRNRAVGALAARRARILELLGNGHCQADVQRTLFGYSTKVTPAQDCAWDLKTEDLQS